VVLDATTGRWRAGTRPAAPPQLFSVRRHGQAAAAERAANLLIHGEAMDALVALGPSHAGRFRLIYLDPPYNTGQDMGAYVDRADAGVWLSCLEERLVQARSLLGAGAFVVVHVGEAMQGVLRVLLDELFGADARVAQIAWQRAPDRTVLGQGVALIPDHVEYLLVYRHGPVPRTWPRPTRRVPFPAKTLATYARELAPSPRARLVERFADPAGESVAIYAHDGYELVPVRKAERARPSPASFARRIRLTNQQPESTFQQRLLARMPARDVLYRAEFQQRRGKHAGLRRRYYLNGNVVLWLNDVAELDDGALVRVADLDNLWTTDEIPVTGVAGEGGVSFRRGKKPERLLERVIGTFSRPGEWVLDFFAGSGTTGAVAERLGRPWVVVEAGAHARSLCEPRLGRAVLASGGGFEVMTVVRRP
jgi:adenine-specific DNA-methyltransferase